MALARHAIIDGKKVALIEANPHMSPDGLDEFTFGILSRFGFLSLAQKIVSRRALDVEEIEVLLTEASLPILMKLVELRKGTVVNPSITPAVVLPLSLWRRFGSDLEEAARLSKDFLQEIPHEVISVSFDRIDLDYLQPALLRFFRQIADARPGIMLLGPSIDEVVAFPGIGDSAVTPEFLLRRRLEFFRESGFTRLMATSSEEFLGLTHELGFLNYLVTDINHYPGFRELAEELKRIAALASKRGLVDIWSPGVRINNLPLLHDDPITDFRLLRILAVSALCFDHAPVVRASSRYLSLEAIHFARYLGADDLGYGAFDSLTKKTLRVKPLGALTRAMLQH